ncbi:MAG TPA: hypothetical protein VKC90_14535 [Chitinophagaceae bacterium]|nr:hypothetical protein [Chitinophagaceae bacterium]
METTKHDSHLRPLLTQTRNNTTLWIGHLQTDPTDHFAGQTFTSPSDGLLDNIQVYTSAVQQPGEMLLTLHEFDNTTKTWGRSIGNSAVALQRGDDSKWIQFKLQPLSLRRDAVYGFRLQTSNAMIGIGEAATGTKEPFTFGHEWSGDSKNIQGHFYTYFSLTFKVELRA